MKKQDLYILKGKVLITLSVMFFIGAISLSVIDDVKAMNDNYELSFEYVNIKDMATASVATKKAESTNIIDTLTKATPLANDPTEVPLNEETVEETTLPLMNNTVPTLETPKQIWYLPTEYGEVTQNPNYGHVALDITSPRGYAETIYPVANGTISGIYTDGAGARIVTVHHYINGQNYTSQYVHLSSYAPNLYVGKPVTINDYLGQMGSTGRSTGVHLHLAVLDCSLFDSNDPYCSDLNGFFNYANSRLGQGYIGLGTQMYVPGSWSSR